MYRYGGEGFVAILPYAGADGALITARRIVAAVASSTFSFGSTGIPVTTSAGPTLLFAGEEMSAAVARADAALNEAKKAGRNSAVLL